MKEDKSDASKEGIDALKELGRQIIVDTPVLSSAKEVDKVLKAPSIVGGTPESTKLKKKMLLGKKKKDTMKEKLPEHIRKAYITINDKKPSEPIKVEFSGDWSGSDLNLAGKHLILEYNLFVRNRAIRE